MTVVSSSQIQTLQGEANAEVRTAIADRISRCGECNVKTSYLRGELKRHFGFSGAKSGRVLAPILRVLISSGMLEPFDQTAKGDVVFKVISQKWGNT